MDVKQNYTHILAKDWYQILPTLFSYIADWDTRT